MMSITDFAYTDYYPKEGEYAFYVSYHFNEFAPENLPV